MSLAVNGSSACLMKVMAKKRRSKAQVKEERKIEADKDAALAAKVQAISDLEARLAAMEAKMEQTDEVASQIHGFFDQGVLENDGTGKVKVAEAFFQRELEQTQQRKHETDHLQSKQRRMTKVF